MYTCVYSRCATRIKLLDIKKKKQMRFPMDKEVYSGISSNSIKMACVYIVYDLTRLVICKFFFFFLHSNITYYTNV